MTAPLYSTITLFAEIIVSSIIYYTIYQGYNRNKFPARLAGLALFYEIIFNITYMVSRTNVHIKEVKLEPPFVIGVAITHGVLSLIMFLSLIVFFIIAWKKYRSGINYFKIKKALTFAFLAFWSFSVVSGILFYLVEYVF